jgi:hypothetical protein
MPVYNDGTGRRESGRYPTLEDAQWAATQLFEAYRPHAWIERITTRSERVADPGAASPRPGAEATSEDSARLDWLWRNGFLEAAPHRPGFMPRGSLDEIRDAIDAEIEAQFAARSSSGSPASEEGTDG